MMKSTNEIIDTPANIQACEYFIGLFLTHFTFSINNHLPSYFLTCNCLLNNRSYI